MPTLVLAAIQGRWWCPMCGPWGAGGWGMMIFMSLFWLLVIALVAWLVYRLAAGGRGGPGARPRGGEAEEILKQRYARGEIDRETYERMLDELRR